MHRIGPYTIIDGWRDGRHWWLVLKRDELAPHHEHIVGDLPFMTWEDALCYVTSVRKLQTEMAKQ